MQPQKWHCQLNSCSLYVIFESVTVCNESRSGTSAALITHPSFSSYWLWPLTSADCMRTSQHRIVTGSTLGVIWTWDCTEGNSAMTKKTYKYAQFCCQVFTLDFYHRAVTSDLFWSHHLVFGFFGTKSDFEYRETRYISSMYYYSYYYHYDVTGGADSDLSIIR